MDEKILMNKNSLAALKSDLRGYQDALPVFEMKEQQLKSVVRTVEDGIAALKVDIERTNEAIKSWVAVLAEADETLAAAVEVERIVTEPQEIAGVAVKSFVDIQFAAAEPDYYVTPLWVDTAIEAVRDQKTRHAILRTEQDKRERLREELAEARRMKNALKEVFIPEAKEMIRKIEIYLGDVERLAIGCAKLVKKKKEKKKTTA